MRNPRYDDVAKRIGEALSKTARPFNTNSLEKSAKIFDKTVKDLRNYRSPFAESDYERLHRLQDILKGRVCYLTSI